MGTSESSIVSAVINKEKPAKKFGVRQMMKAVRHMKELLEREESKFELSVEEKLELESQLKAAREDILRLKDEYEAASAAEKATMKDALRSELLAAKEVCEELRNVATKAEEDKEHVLQELKTRNDELDETNELLNVVKDELDKMKTTTLEMSDEQRRKSRAKEMLKDALENKIETLRAEISHREATIQGLVRYKVEAESRSKAASEELVALQEEKDAILAVNDEMKHERDELGLALVTLHKKFDAAAVAQCETHAKALQKLEDEYAQKEKDLEERQIHFEARVEAKYKKLYDAQSRELERARKQAAAAKHEARAAQSQQAKLAKELQTKNEQELLQKKENEQELLTKKKNEQDSSSSSSSKSEDNAPPPQKKESCLSQAYVEDFSKQLLEAYKQSMDSRNNDAVSMQGLAQAQLASQSAFDKFADAYGTLATIGKMHAEATKKLTETVHAISPAKHKPSKKGDAQ